MYQYLYIFSAKVQAYFSNKGVKKTQWTLVTLFN